MELVQISYTLKDTGQLKALTLFAVLISEELQFNGVMLPKREDTETKDPVRRTRQ